MTTPSRTTVLPGVTRNAVVFACVVVALLAAAVACYVWNRRIDVSRRAFAVEGFTPLIQRVDQSVASISRRVAADGYEEDFSALFAKMRVPPPPPPSPAETAVAEASVAAPPPAPAALKLTGIAWKAHAPLAFVNDLTLSVGDVVAGCRVTRIDPERVTLTASNGQTRVLELYEEPARPPPESAAAVSNPPAVKAGP